MFRVSSENRDFVFSGLVFLACWLLLTVIAMRPIIAFDTFWHLQMGKDFMENGLSPWIDHYSFSYLGETISSIPIIFQIVLYEFVSFFGEERGFYFIKVLYVTLMMLVLWAYFRKTKANFYIVFLLVPLITYTIPLRLLIRPEIFSSVLVVICLFLYQKAQKRFETKEIVYILLLLLFWKSYHSPVLGYIIIFGLFLEKAINKLIHQNESFDWQQWFVWGVLVFLTGFFSLNADYFVGQHFLVSMLATISEGFGSYIKEYEASYENFSTNILVHVSWVLSVYVVIWSLLKKQYGFAFIVVLLTYFSWSMTRLVAVAMLINLCILATYYTQFLSSHHWSTIRSSVKRLLFIVSISIPFMAFYFLGIDAEESINKHKQRQQILEQRYPIKAADYLNKYQKGGNVLNVMQFGSFLVNKLSPDYKIYYDGRSNILYPIEFVIHNDELWGSVKEVNDVIEKFDVSYVLRENRPQPYVFLNNFKQLKLAYADDNYLLFARDEHNTFPLASQLLVFPICWNEEMIGGIRAEMLLADQLLSHEEYALNEVLAFMEKYLSADDKQAFFSVLSSNEIKSDSVRRLVFYLAMEHADEVKVSRFFASILVKNSYDVLLYSYYLAQRGSYEDAEKLGYYFYTSKIASKKIVSYDKLGILARTLRIVNENSELKSFESSYLKKLESAMIKVNYDMESELSLDFICQK